MLQILQSLETGDTQIVDVPSPSPKKDHILIETRKTLVSAGTERMLVNFGKANLLQKAMSQPERVKDVIQKARVDGIASTMEAVRSKLDQPLPLGYCNVGIVADSGQTNFAVGSRVVSNGNHAEVVRVPKNLVVEVPNEVDDESAAFTVMGAIAMQGVRLLKPTLGETIVVTGLGLLGLLSVQILKANGCRVIGIDFDPKKCALARQFGAESVDLSKKQDPVGCAIAFSRGVGVDGVLITATSPSNEIMREAATMCRKRGRIVLVGVIGLDLNRADFYEKELSFQVSCSYGPGRYDPTYEEFGNDYPISFVRWTEQRNFEAVLDLMAAGSIDVMPLINHRFDIQDAKEAYEKLSDPNSLGILLHYRSSKSSQVISDSVRLKDSGQSEGGGNVAFIGGGNYASRTLIPAFRQAGATLTTLVTSGGINSVHHGKKHGFKLASTNMADALTTETDTVVIATQHNLHADQVIRSLESGKNVFVEKPLAISMSDLERIENACGKSHKILMVGYNRRFSPHIRKVKELLEPKKMPKCFIMTMNAGYIPKEHWTQNLEVGGGRIVGEACHYIDLMRFLSGSKIASFNALKIDSNHHMEITEDKAIINLSFEDGSIGTIHYFANGGKSFPKERIEVFCDDAVLQLDNFRSLKGFGWPGFNSLKTWSQNKGQVECVKEFMTSVKNDSDSPIPQNEVFEVARVSLAIADQLKS
ncbi:bi-domain-containing oxidoreductase [Gammaproteobacteria bacterium]|nr:bi-domain-containing oxidoreductase [Gammaproteobacteria bacterium]